MAYESTTDGCIDFVLPKETQDAIKAAWEYLTSEKGLRNTAEDGSAEWNYGPWSCMANLPLTAAVLCCPCWASCINYRDEEWATGNSCQVAFVNGIAASALCLGPCHAAVIRGGFRKKYGLKGSPAMDCVCVCCCGPCSLCSMTNELMSRQGVKVPYLELKGGK